MKVLQKLKEDEKEYDKLLESYKQNDPEEFKRLCKQVETNKACANRWTDNIWVCKKFLTRSRGMPGKEVGLFIIFCTIAIMN